MLRFDAAIARAICTQYKNAKPSDFMPWPREEEVEATPETLLALLKASSKVKT